MDYEPQQLQGEPERRGLEIFGFPLRIDPFFFFTAWIIGGRQDLQWMLVWIAVVFTGVLAHELGHAFAGQRLGMQYRAIHNLTSVPNPRAPHLHHEDGKTSVLMRNGRAISRNAHSMVIAGEMLLLGRDRYVVAVDAKTDAELWRAPVDGKAYELAVADGRLIIGTDRGTV